MLLPLLVACSASNDAPITVSDASTGGTIVISSPSEPDNLMPPVTTALSGRQVEDQIYEHLADIGASQNSVGDKDFTPSLARSWSWAPDSLSISFRLDSAARWHDGKPVRAKDVQFSVALYLNPATGSSTTSLLNNIDSASVRDSLTAVVWFKVRRPEQFFDIAYQVYILPSHLLASTDPSKLAASPLAMAPIGSGPFRFVRWDAKQTIELAADTTGGRRRAQLDRVVYTMAPDPNTAFTRVAAGEADVFEAVRPDKLAEISANPQLRLYLMASLDYNYFGFNLVNPKTNRPHRIFGDVRMRRALTMATDRRSIVANIYDSLAIVARGPFTTAQASSDPTLLPVAYSVDSANTILDAAGWVRGVDSLRSRNGVPLAFSIAVPTTSVARMRAAVLLQEQFRRIGANATIDQSDMGGFLQRLESRNFDAIMGAFHADPSPGSVRESWGSAATGKDGNNFGAYRSAAFDAQVDSGTVALAPDVMRKHFAAAWRIIANDAPSIWLAEPRQAVVINSRFVTTGMRPDAWWAALAQWRVPADKRITRDAPLVAGTAR
jgi:peptide/nickel transport system substrate-binding protein